MSDKNNGIDKFLDDAKTLLTVCNNSERKEFEITNEELDSPNAAIFWSNPDGKMTIVFQPCSNSRSKFNLRLKNTHNIEEDILLYRVLNRKELPIEKSEEDVLLECDMHYEVVVKVVVSKSDTNCYGVQIPYSIEPQPKVTFAAAKPKN